ncbi:MAG TPA: transposase [Verrucomicrobia bacterium]|nr:transposase [Verrucomicrobiota bacterium]
MKNLKCKLSRTTVANILRENGMDPAPERSKKRNWKTFLRSHWEHMAASDFFSVEVLTLHGLVTYYVLFVIELSTRRVKIVGITPNPDGEFMAQCARNLTDCDDGFLQGKKYIIHDRDKKYTDQFDELLEDTGVKPVKLPPRSPNLNSHAERYVLSIKSECLNRYMVFGEKMLRKII